MAVVLAVSLAVVVLGSAAAYLCGLALSDRAEPLRYRILVRLGLRKREQPTSRPIEAIAADVRRLAARYYSLQPRTSYVKVEAVRFGYDRVLGECCTALGLTHLLGVLTPGPERDAERTRVEGLLADSGVRFPHAA
jgi:hypothetical protein